MRNTLFWVRMMLAKEPSQKQPTTETVQGGGGGGPGPHPGASTRVRAASAGEFGGALSLKRPRATPPSEPGAEQSSGLERTVCLSPLSAVPNSC
jgi:hypothetical protein